MKILRKKDWTNLILLLITGILTHFSLVIIDHLKEGIVWDTLLLLYIPGLAIGTVLALRIVDFKSNKKWWSFWIIIFLSIIACFASAVLCINLIWASWWSDQTVWNTLLMSEYTVGIWSGLLGGIILSLIPNFILKITKLKVLHLITWFVGSVLGQLLFFLADFHNFGISIGYGIWFAILGTLTIKNFDRMKQKTTANTA